MKYSKIIFLILTCCFALASCTQEDSDKEKWVMDDQWNRLLCEQPPLILFDYDKTDSKDRFSFDCVLYRMDQCILTLFLAG